MNKLKILVIDDDPFVLKSCRRILETENYNVTLCSSLQEAVIYLEKDKFHLIIKDVVMPEYNNVDLNNKFKEVQNNTKTLTMSGYTAPIPISEMIDKEDANFLPKPFTPEELMSAVWKILNEKSFTN